MLVIDNHHLVILSKEAIKQLVKNFILRLFRNTAEIVALVLIKHIVQFLKENYLVTFDGSVAECFINILCAVIDVLDKHVALQSDRMKIEAKLIGSKYYIVHLSVLPIGLFLSLFLQLSLISCQLIGRHLCLAIAVADADNLTIDVINSPDATQITGRLVRIIPDDLHTYLQLFAVKGNGISET